MCDVTSNGLRKDVGEGDYGLLENCTVWYIHLGTMRRQDRELGTPLIEGVVIITVLHIYGEM
jgi:hypothetical protein